MHVGGITVDLNWFIQLVLTVFFIAFGLLYLVKNTASKYFEVDASFEGTDRSRHVMPSIPMEADNMSCAVCGNPGNKKCSRCKSVRYCSSKCQTTHWHSGHKTKCKDQAKVNSTQSMKSKLGSKASVVGGKANTGIALVPSRGASKVIKKPGKVLFPYEEFVKLFNWDKPGFPPCGLLNCGNSCFANVVLQCLSYTRPLVAYLLEKGHRRECRRDDWCFMCELQIHVEKASQSLHPFSPLSILSRLPNIGGNLGYGRQEDAHEFMRFAIDTMQSICLDEFGGEKAVHPCLQETTLIQHIFGGHLQSQVMCTSCNNISNQYENMMDLTVEIHGDAASLEECLEQFTAKECLHGDNMYKCDGCNDYVKAWKRLTIRRAPNILTIALKRFQSGRFGKLNKRVSFPETLDLSPYMSEEGDGTDVYKLYAVVVHVDMLNASFFGHYICYIKDFRGNWYRVDDCKVASVELEEVLSQGAYMLLYSRVSARSSYLTTTQPFQKELQVENMDVEPSPNEVECSTNAESVGLISRSESLLSDHTSYFRAPSAEDESFSGADSQVVTEHLGDNGFCKTTSRSSHLLQSDHEGESSFDFNPQIVREDPHQINVVGITSSSPDQKDLPNGSNKPFAAVNSEAVAGNPEFSGCNNGSCIVIDSHAASKVSVDAKMVNSESGSYVKPQNKDFGSSVFNGLDGEDGNRISRAGILNGSS